MADRSADAVRVSPRRRHSVYKQKAAAFRGF
jgi:hypothetical protein